MQKTREFISERKLIGERKEDAWRTLPLLDDTSRYKISLQDSFLKVLTETFYEFEFVLDSFYEYRCIFC